MNRLAGQYPSLQNACIYRLNYFQGFGGAYFFKCSDVLKDMVSVIANPSYKDDLPTVYNFLSRMLDCLKNNQDVENITEEWFLFGKELVVRKINELKLIARLPAPPSESGSSGSGCVLQ